MRTSERPLLKHLVQRLPELRINAKLINLCLLVHICFTRAVSSVGNHLEAPSAYPTTQNTMKASTTASIVLGLLSNPAMATDPVKSQIEVPVGGVTFKLSKFHDGRTTPYRLYFWDEYLTGSSYRFGKTGYLEYFKAGSEVYYDRMEKTDGSVAYKSKEASESGGRHEANDHMATMNQEAVGCDDCVDDLAVLCGYSLPMFCESTDKSYLGMSGAASVDIVCDNYKGICSILEAGCATLCDAENGHSEWTRNYSGK